MEILDDPVKLAPHTFERAFAPLVHEKAQQAHGYRPSAVREYLLDDVELLRPIDDRAGEKAAQFRPRLQHIRNRGEVLPSLLD
jgi:hypothetical protein